MTDKKTEALKLALEALGWTDEWRPQGLREEATTALREALAEKPAQRTWVALTDGDIYKMTILMGFNPEWKPEVEMVYSIVRNLEAKLKEKNQ